MAELTDEKWERIKPQLPPQKKSRKGGRPRADDRACLEGILWVLRSGARWKDLPKDRGFPSPATCWRRLGRWERAGVWLRMWTAFLDELDERGRLDWEECFADATFAPAKGGKLVGKTKRGKGSKLVVVVDGEGVPLALTTHSASPSETKMIEPTLDRLPEGRTPEHLVMDKAFDSDAFRDRIAARGTYPVVPYRKRAVSKKYGDGRKLRRYKRRWKVERTFAWFGNFRRLVVRYEHKHWIYRAFVHLACILITLRKF